MRAFVFTDPALSSRAGQFVWLAINTDQPENADFEEAFALDAWPTFYVVRPSDESVALRWVGAMTVDQVDEFLGDARLVLEGTTPASTAEMALARADRLYAAGDNVQAAETYRLVLDAVPPDRPSYPRAVESLLFAYMAIGAPESCVTLARETLPRLGGATSAVNVSVNALACALDLEDDDPDRPAALADMEAAVRRALDDPKTGAAADDLSSGYLFLVRARIDAGDEAGARKEAADWAGFLEAHAAAAETPERRTVFDSHRLRAYVELGQPERAIPMLEASERDLPEDDNPPARLVVAYEAMKRWDEALAANERAIEKAPGPRRVRHLQKRAALYTAAGDDASARRVLGEALALAESLPAGERNAGLVAALREELAADAPAGGEPAS